MKTSKMALTGLLALMIFMVSMIFMIPGRALTPARAGDLKDGPAAFIPELDWLTPKGPAQEVAGLENLFAAINGGAEAYISHGFVRAVFQSLAAKDGRSFNLEIYELEQAAGAEALFNKKTSDLKPLPLADQAALGDYYLICRQGNHYISLTGPDSKPVTLDQLRNLARAILSRMGG